jgi:hypothetical protein
MIPPVAFLHAHAIVSPVIPWTAKPWVFRVAL